MTRFTLCYRKSGSLPSGAGASRLFVAMQFGRDPGPWRQGTSFRVRSAHYVMLKKTRFYIDSGIVRRARTHARSRYGSTLTSVPRRTSRRPRTQASTFYFLVGYMNIQGIFFHCQLLMALKMVSRLSGMWIPPVLSGTSEATSSSTGPVPGRFLRSSPGRGGRSFL